MNRRIFWSFLALAVLGMVATACGGGAAPTPTPAASAPVEPVKMAARPASLEGQTVVLRWNGKPNGDKLLTRIGELLKEQVKDVKVVSMWEVDKETAIISDSDEKSEAIAAQIAEQKPALVIAAQAD